MFSPVAYWIGLREVQKKNWDEATVVLQKALIKQPNNAFINFKLGLCYMKLEDWNLSYEYLTKAVLYNQNRAQWHKQLNSVEKEIEKQSRQQTKKRIHLVSKKTSKKHDLKISARINKVTPATMTRDEIVDFGEFQLELLTCNNQITKNYVEFIQYVLTQESYLSLLIQSKYFSDKLVVFFENYLGIAECDIAFVERSLNKLRDVNFDRDQTNYLQAYSLYRQAKYQDALAALHELIATSRNPHVMYYLLGASSAINLKKNDVAYKLVKEASSFSNRALIWRYFSMLCDTSSKAIDLYRLYRSRVKDGKLSLGNYSVLNNVVSALLDNNETILAKKMVQESTKFILEHPNPARLNKKTLKYSTEDYLPEWSIPFANLDASIVESDTARIKNVLFNTITLLNRKGLKVFCDGKTLQSVVFDDFNLCFPSSLELGVLGSDQLDEILKVISQSGMYFPATFRQKEKIASFKSLSGITLELRVYEQKSTEKYSFYRAGKEWLCNKFKLRELIYENKVITIPSEDYFLFERINKKEHEPLGDLDYFYQLEDVDNHGVDQYIVDLYLCYIKTRIMGDEILALKIRKELRGKDSKHIFMEENNDMGCEIQPLEFIEEYRPEIVLYLTGLENVAYQGNMWLPILEKLPCKVAIVIREARIADQLNKTEIPVFFMRNLRELEFLGSSGVVTILYPANAQKNIQTIRFYKINHFFINHGESDKVVNQSKFLMAYDKLLVAGPLAEKRLHDARLPVRDGQVVHVGRPQVELLLDQLDQPVKKIKTILYAPTWEGFVEEANYSSVSDFGLTMLKKLVKSDIKLYFKPHPYTGYNKKGDTGKYLDDISKFCQKNNITIVDSKDSIFDYMNLCDLMITDISSVLNDFLYTQKPMILTNPRNIDVVELHKTYPSSPATYDCINPSNILEIISSIEINDDLRGTRNRILKESLGDIPEGYLERFKTVVMGSLSIKNEE